MIISDKIIKLDATKSELENITGETETVFNRNFYPYRTNLVNNFVGWATSNANTFVSDGVLKIVDNSVNGFHECYTPVACTNEVYTASIEFKKDTASKGRLWVVKTAQGCACDFDLDAMTCVPVNFGGALYLDCRMTALDDGWVRVEVSGRLNLTSAYFDLALRDNGIQYAGTGKSMFARKPQFELGYFSTDYMLVNAASSNVVRSIPPPTLLSKVIKAKTPPVKPIDFAVLYHCDNGQNNANYNDIEIFQDANASLILRVTRQNSIYCDINFGIYAPNTEFTIAFSIDNRMRACLNGIIHKELPCVFPQDLSFERFGTQLQGIRNWNSYIYYELGFDRILTKNELTALAAI
jgi:hypothetical protein